VAYKTIHRNTSIFQYESVNFRPIWCLSVSIQFQKPLLSLWTRNVERDTYWFVTIHQVLSWLTYVCIRNYDNDSLEWSWLRDENSLFPWNVTYITCSYYFLLPFLLLFEMPMLYHYSITCLLVHQFCSRYYLTCHFHHYCPLVTN